jgi:hypothetical protein
MSPESEPAGAKAPVKVDFKKWMLVVEGNSDEWFFRRLCIERQIPDYGFFRGGQGELPAGKTGFSKVLRALRVMPGFEVVEGIIVATDTDDDPKKAFSAAAGQLKEAEYEVPSGPLQWTAGAKGMPPVSVLLIPWHDEAGTLEQLVLPAAEAKWPTEYACLEQYAQCTKAEAWHPSKRAKMMTRSLMSAVHEPDPNIGLANLWERSATKDYIPLIHAHFDRIAKFLETRQAP